jgi:hypothetical protein
MALINTDFCFLAHPGLDPNYKGIFQVGPTSSPTPKNVRDYRHPAQYTKLLDTNNGCCAISDYHPLDTGADSETNRLKIGIYFEGVEFKPATGERTYKLLIRNNNPARTIVEQQEGLAWRPVPSPAGKQVSLTVDNSLMPVELHLLYKCNVPPLANRPYRELSLKVRPMADVNMTSTFDQLSIVLEAG